MGIRIANQRALPGFANRTLKPMKTSVFILIPFEVSPGSLLRVADELLGRHRAKPDESGAAGRYDYLVGAEGCLNDAVTEGRLPLSIRRIVAGRICEAERLPPEYVPGALVTPDGVWHDLGDFGWRLIDGRSASNIEAETRWEVHYRELLGRHPYCWVLEERSHS